MPKSTVYGPVPSWRLGRSLGIDMLCTETKTCNFDCTYCQLGPAAQPVTERGEFVQLTKLSDDIQAAKAAGVVADCVTFSGMGEPTLAANLGPAINLVRSALGLPVNVFTNGSLLKREDVRRDLALADRVIVKMDATDDALFIRVNRPAGGTHLWDVLQGMQLFRLEFKGRIAADVMVNDINRANGFQLQANIRAGLADEVFLNAAVGRSAEKPVGLAELAELKRDWFWNFKASSIYDKRELVSVAPLDEEELELRHPRKAKPAAEANTPAQGTATASA